MIGIKGTGTALQLCKFALQEVDLSEMGNHLQANEAKLETLEGGSSRKACPNLLDWVENILSEEGGVDVC